MYDKGYCLSAFLFGMVLIGFMCVTFIHFICEENVSRKSV